METTNRRLLCLARIFGIGLHLPMLLVFVVQGLTVPTEGVMFLLALWVAMLVAGVLLWRRGSFLIALIPVVDVVIIYAVTFIGKALFGWRP